MDEFGRRGFVAALGCALAATSAQPGSAQDAAAPDPKLVDDLAAANRILVDQGVLDGFGHISARHDKRPDRFLMARSMAPGLVTAADIMEFDLDGAPVEARGRSVYLERFIHSEIYRMRPDVKSVVHSHSPAVLPFAVTTTPLKPLYHMAGFLGAGAPVFEIRATAGADTDMLISDPARGKALAVRLGANTVVLMRGHGWVVVGSSVRTAVLHAVYTEINARAESEALKLGNVTYLNPAEAARTMAQNDKLADRPWEIWRSRVMGK